MVARLRREHSGNGMDAATSVLGDEGLANATLAAPILFRFSMGNRNRGHAGGYREVPRDKSKFRRHFDGRGL